MVKWTSFSSVMCSRTLIQSLYNCAQNGLIYIMYIKFVHNTKNGSCWDVKLYFKYYWDCVHLNCIGLSYKFSQLCRWIFKITFIPILIFSMPHQHSNDSVHDLWISKSILVIKFWFIKFYKNDVLRITCNKIFLSPEVRISIR